MRLVDSTFWDSQCTSCCSQYSNIAENQEEQSHCHPRHHDFLCQSRTLDFLGLKEEKWHYFMDWAFVSKKLQPNFVWWQPDYKKPLLASNASNSLE